MKNKIISVVILLAVSALSRPVCGSSQIDLAPTDLPHQTSVKVRAPINISFIKYWGKREESLNLPTKDSFGVSLSEVFTETTISINGKSRDKILVLDDETNFRKTQDGILKYLALFREKTGCKHHFEIVTRNNFPTVSGFSALASGLT